MYKGKPGASPKAPKIKKWAKTPQPEIPGSGFTAIKASQATVGNTSTTEKE